MDTEAINKLRVFFEDKLHITQDEFDRLNIIENCTYIQLDKRSLITKEGDISKDLFFILSGELKVETNNIEIARVTAPSISGMLSYYEENRTCNASLYSEKNTITEIIKISFDYLSLIKKENNNVYEKKEIYEL